MLKRLGSIILFTLGLGAFIAACTANTSQSSVLASDLEVSAAPARVRQAYEFAVSNPEALKNVPCYCGCVGMGHKNNYACYIKEQNADGAIVFDDHAIGCQICVDITFDVIKLTRQNKPASAIRAHIIENYAKYGPPTE